jgi:hypothetical protein
MSRHGFETLLRSAGLCAENVCIRALRETLAIEGGSQTARLVSSLPDAALRCLLPVFPTLCYTARKRRPTPAE